MQFLQQLKHAFRSLTRTPGFFLTVVLTLGLGIGANAAIFSVVRGILLRPLANRDEARLIYIRQAAPGIGAENVLFSVPEIADLRSRVSTLGALCEFSTINFAVVGLGEPRQVRAGVVDGRYFEVMGLKPVLGRLLGPRDDGPSVPGAVVLTHRFWTNGLAADPTVVGRTIRLGANTATVVGVLEPAVGYPTETELVANVVTSPHHLSAAMTTDRQHRMTQVFGRLAPGATLETARTELTAVHAAIKAEHAGIYDTRADFRIEANGLRDQINDRARTILLVLMGAAGLVFVIACANVANLILARTLRRQPELALRAALGATRQALRSLLLAECVLLAGSGAILGLLIAGPLVRVLARYTSLFSARADELTLDTSLLWVAAGLSVLSALVFAFIPRLPSNESTSGLTSTTTRTTGRTRGGQRAFAVAQVAASFLLVTGAGTLVQTLIALERTRPGFETENVLAVNVPVMSYQRKPEQIRQFYEEVRSRVAALPGVRNVSVGSSVPWRDEGGTGGGAGRVFTIEGSERKDPNDESRANFRSVSPGFFATLGIRLLEGRDFTDADRSSSERVVIVSESIARRLFGNRDVVGRHLRWTDPIVKFVNVSGDPRRIVGVVADVRDVDLDSPPVMTVYHPFQQETGGGRLFVYAEGNPYALVPPVTRVIRELASDQPVERASTLADIRAEVLAPSRLNAIVIGGFAVLAMTIAVVGVAGVLAFSVNGRTREFGIRLAVGSRSRDLLLDVLREGVMMAGAGIAIGFALSAIFTRVAGGVLPGLPGLDPISLISAAILLAVVATIAAAVPAARAARVDVMEALRLD